MRVPPTAKVAAVACCLLALAGQVVFGLRVLLLGLELGPAPGPLPGLWPWLVNLGWLAAFAAQHSGMARAGFKQRWTCIVPPLLERSVYAALSGLLLLGLGLTWQPLVGEPCWSLPPGFVIVPLAAATGVAWITARFDGAGLFGLRQVWEGGPSQSAEVLRVVGPYRWVRHPLMTCTLLFLWAQPVMAPALLLLAGGMTVYVIAALQLEERDLRSRFGTAHADYCRRVPALLPWRRPVPAACYPAPPAA